MATNPQLNIKVRIFPGITPDTYYNSLSGTDITALVRLQDGITFSRGASDETSFPSAGRCTLVLNNRDFRFTPDNTASSLFPNIKNRMPLRLERTSGSAFVVSAFLTSGFDTVTATVAVGHGMTAGQFVTISGASDSTNNGVFYVTSVTSTTLVFRNLAGGVTRTNTASGIASTALWTGFVETLEEHWNFGVLPTVVLTASDRLALFARQKLTNLIAANQKFKGAFAIYPLADDSGSISSADISGNGYGALKRKTYGTTTTSTLQTQDFSVGDFGSEPDGNVLKLFSPSSAIGYYMGATTQIPASATGLVEGYFYLPNGEMNSALLRIESHTRGYAIHATSPATMTVYDLGTGAAPSGYTNPVITGHATTADLEWHHFAFSWSNSGSASTWTLYVDGVSQGTWSETIASGPPVVSLFVGGSPSTSPATCWAANVCIYASALTSTDMVDNAKAVGGFAESSLDKFSRIMLTSGNNVFNTTGTASTVMGALPTAGQNLLDIFQQINDAEDGAIYHSALDITQYVSQTARDTLGAVVTIDPKYLSPSTMLMRAPASVNQVIASRPNGGSVTASDTVSIAENGTMTESVSLYVANDADLQKVAKRRLYRRATQQPRIGNVTIDLATSPAVNDSILGIDVGSYLSIGPLPRGDIDTLLVRVEGVSDSITPSSWTRTIVTSPAYVQKSGSNWVLGTSKLDYTTTIA
jgi:hypothetical protein